MIEKRIKNIRKKRGMTQKELGVVAGFNAKSADVRIAQYESGKRKPKEKILTSIANALKDYTNILIRLLLLLIFFDFSQVYLFVHS